jgi:hypothetical protein
MSYTTMLTGIRPCKISVKVYILAAYPPLWNDCDEQVDESERDKPDWDLTGQLAPE